MNNSLSCETYNSPAKFRLTTSPERMIIIVLGISFKAQANCEKKPNPHWINENEMWYVQTYFGGFSSNDGDWSAI